MLDWHNSFQRKMKKLSFTIIGLLIPLLAVAQRISNDEAMDIASQVLGKQVVKAEVKKSARASEKEIVQSEEPFYSLYTGEDGNGFVIVSTDRRAPQIIGYGDSKADINNLPPQLKAILEKQDSVLQATPNLPEHPSWKQKTTRADSEGGKLLKTANWGQGYPYNLMTPEIDGQHCPTGCVATAMAILMKYYEWPQKGRGSYGYYSVSTNADLQFDYNSYSPDWENMKMDYSETDFSQDEAMAVSKLMSAAGIAIGINSLLSGENPI